ncbi:unnamed protein product [Cuscuta campestris]|uniref:Uncharacterized protein n=1 Tax=Cuscuta campestris TaxID=132261 RepID=A0A484KYY4_9ASTE|nr:unnamed protein product [Cuscuta campestris]
MPSQPPGVMRKPKITWKMVKNCAFTSQVILEDEDSLAKQLTDLQEKWTELLMMNRRNIAEKNGLISDINSLKQKHTESKIKLREMEREKLDLRFEVNQLKDIRKWMKIAGAEVLEKQEEIFNNPKNKTSLGYTEHTVQEHKMLNFVKATKEAQSSYNIVEREEEELLGLQSAIDPFVPLIDCVQDDFFNCMIVADQESGRDHEGIVFQKNAGRCDQNPQFVESNATLVKSPTTAQVDEDDYMGGDNDELNEDECFIRRDDPSFDMSFGNEVDVTLDGGFEDGSDLAIGLDKRLFSLNFFFYRLQRYHITCNLRKRFPKLCKKGLDKLFEDLANAYTKRSFKRLYGDLKARYPTAGNYIDKIPKKRWARAYFEINRNQIMTTNGVESINSVLREARELLIVALLKAVQNMTSRWRGKRQQELRNTCISHTRKQSTSCHMKMTGIPMEWSS